MSKDNSNIILFGGLAALGVFILSTDSKASLTNISPPPGPGGSVPKTPSAFVKKFYPFAVRSEMKTGVPALVTLAQGGLESAWGKSAYGNNFFGIKVGKDWKGEVQKLKTWECSRTSDELIQIFPPGSPGSNPSCNAKGKTSYRVYAKFRAYDTPGDGFIDHGEFLKNNKRYKNAFLYKDTPTRFALEVAKAGYATAPNYGEVLIQTIINIKKVLGTTDTSW